MSSSRLYIAAKPPLPGVVKTRLARTIGPVAATALYSAFLDDISSVVREMDTAAGWFVPPLRAWQPPNLGPRQLASRWQRGATWEERQARLFHECQRDPAGSVVLIASDSPQLTGAEIGMAFRGLRESDIVLGPTLDGGYYLVGMRASHDILRPVPMSTEHVSAEVLARASRLGLSVTLLPPTYDVDEVLDLDLLADAVATRPHLRATAAALTGIQAMAR